MIRFTFILAATGLIAASQPSVQATSQTDVDRAPAAAAEYVRGHDIDHFYRQGRQAFANGRFAAAVKLWGDALVTLPAASENRATIEVDIATAYRFLGFHDQSRALLTRLLAADNRHNAKLVIRANDQLAMAHVASFDFVRAEKLWDDALIMARGLEDTAAVVNILLNRASLTFMQRSMIDKQIYGRFHTAYPRTEDGFKMLDESLALSRQLEDAALTARILLTYAQASMSFKGGKAPDQLLQTALRELDSLDSTYSTAFMLVAGARVAHRIYAQGKSVSLFDQASGIYQRSIRIARDIDNAVIETYSLGYLAELHEAAGEHDEGLRLARLAALVAQEHRSNEALFRWQWLVGRLAKKLDRTETAGMSFENAKTTLSEIQRDVIFSPGNTLSVETFSDSMGTFYLDYADLLIADDRLHEAREIVELVKLAEMENYVKDPCARLAAGAEIELDHITDNAAVVYYVPLADRLEILVSTRSGISRRTVDTCRRDDLRRDALAYRQAIWNRGVHEYRNQTDLHETLIAPLKQELDGQGVTTLVIVPFGFLNGLPYAALYDGEQFLIEQYAVAYAPGLRLTPSDTASRTALNALLCGISRSDAHGDLPAVPSSLEAIRALPGLHGTVLLDEAFSEPAFREAMLHGDHNVLHIESHADFNSWQDCYLVQANDQPLSIDRFETILSAGKYRGPALELVSLAACKSASGDERRFLGLTGIALKSGARSALGSLWQLEDTVAKSFLLPFYETLANAPGATKAEAVQKAQLAIMQTHRHPFYWAPLVLVGNWL